MKKFLLILFGLLLFSTFALAGNEPVIVVKNASYIQRAVSSGDVESVKTLLKENNINPNDIVYKDLGYNLLAYSLMGRNPNAQIVNLLIKSGADVNMPTKNNGMTPLHLITMRDDINDPAEIVKLLIKAGADVNYPDAQKRYIIVRPVIYGNVETVKLLVKAGADVNVKNSQGYSLLKLATMKKIDTKDPKYDETIYILKKAGAK